ncbi:MAG: hypothetical protein LBH70_10075 [Spirochaetaceae bacterium]|nr:hypothetical protein [Spirochaetaceae bacterium]
MFNLKLSALSAALGFVLSLLLSLISGAGIFSLLRAVIFGAGFFVVGSLLYWIVKRFLPELVRSDDSSVPEGMDIGSQVDISLDDGLSLTDVLRQGAKKGSPGAAGDVTGDDRPAAGGLSADGVGLQASGGEEFPANVVDILDQGGETGYTATNIVDGFKPLVFSLPEIPPGGGLKDRLPGNPDKPSAAVLPAGEKDAVDVLPGSGLSFQTFLPFGDDLAPLEGKSGKPVSMTFPGVTRNSPLSEKAVGEFKGKEKESALAIQTVLKRD